MESNKRTLLKLAAGAGAVLGLRALVRRAMAWDLRGRIVLITGGSRGLGLELARAFAHAGARPVLCGREPATLDEALDLLGREGIRASAVACDVTAPDEVAQMIEVVLEAFGRIDVLVNNAGVIEVGPMEEMTLADYDEALQTHFWGPVYTTLAVLPAMKERGVGRIVNITSIGGKVSVPHLLPYCASKFALVGFSEGLRAELARYGLVVTTVVPGLMRTGSPRNATFKGQNRAEYAWFILGDSLPGASISSSRAARRIVDACRHGDAEVTLGLPAQAAARFQGVFPGLTADLLGLVNRVLPGPGGIGTARAKGYQSESALSESWLTGLTQRAARANNEIGVPVP